jgi:hypothetical protein
MKNIATASEDLSSKKKEEPFIIDTGKIKVPVSHPDKIYFPNDNVTKKMVAEYYKEMQVKMRQNSLNLFRFIPSLLRKKQTTLFAMTGQHLHT